MQRFFPPNRCECQNREMTTAQDNLTTLVMEQLNTSRKPIFFSHTHWESELWINKRTLIITRWTKCWVFQVSRKREKKVHKLHRVFINNWMRFLRRVFAKIYARQLIESSIWPFVETFMKSLNRRWECAVCLVIMKTSN